MANETDSFLKAEASANELLQTLMHLKDEVEGYSRAKQSLQTAQEQLITLSEKLGDFAAQSTSVIAAIKRIGTPEILEQVEHIATANEKNNATLVAMKKTVSEGIPSLETSLTHSISDSTSSLQAAIEASHTTAERYSNTLKSQINESQKLVISTTIEHADALKQQVNESSLHLAKQLEETGKKLEKHWRSLKLMLGLSIALMTNVVAVAAYLWKTGQLSVVAEKLGL